MLISWLYPSRDNHQDIKPATIGQRACRWSATVSGHRRMSPNVRYGSDRDHIRASPRMVAMCHDRL